jgi:hypothetical protein
MKPRGDTRLLSEQHDRHTGLVAGRGHNGFDQPFGGFSPPSRNR